MRPFIMAVGLVVGGVGAFIDVLAAGALRGHGYVVEIDVLATIAGLVLGGTLLLAGCIVFAAGLLYPRP